MGLPAHLWKAVEGLARFGTVTETVTEEKATEEETQKLLKKVVSRLGLEPRALALKGKCSLTSAPSHSKKIQDFQLNTLF